MSPRASPIRHTRRPLGSTGLRDRLNSLSWRRLAGPVGARALVAIAVATAVDLDLRIRPGERARGDRRPSCAIPRDRTEPGPQRFGRRPQRVQPEGPAGGRLLGRPGSAAGAGRRQSGPYAARARARDIERSARVTLAVDPDDVRSAASDVFATVHSYDGIVLRSSVRTRSKGDAVASFDLLIPSARLDDALAAFSDIGPVSSRSDASVDVTAPTIGLEERAQDSRAKIKSLLAELSRVGDRRRAGIGRSGAALRAQSARPGAVAASISAAAHAFRPGLAAGRVGSRRCRRRQRLLGHRRRGRGCGTDPRA